MPTANEELQDALIRHQTYLLRYAGSVRNRMLAILQRTEEDIADKIKARLAGTKGLNTPAEYKRLKALVETIHRIRSPAWNKASEVLEEEMVALSLAESVSLSDTVRIVLPVQIAVVLPSARLLRSIALSRPFQGQILSEWAAAMEADDLRRMHNAIQLGMAAGESMDAIARRVIGTGSFNYRDGVTEMTRSQVDSIVRTAVNHVSNHSRTTWFMENNDVITQEYFVATLDSRTTPICRAMDGKTFDLGKGPIPPLHFRCRSLRIAAIDGTLAGSRPAKPYTEKQLVREYAKKEGLGDIDSRDDLPYGSKSGYDKWSRGRIRELVGPIPAETTYEQWMRGQSKTFQDDTLGVSKAKLFRDGKLKLERFVDRNGNELTLQQLAVTERDAFLAAGLNPDSF